MVELLPLIFERVAAGEMLALAIVVQTRGSSPQKAGAAMVVLADGKTIGTLGGGCVEAETRVRALKMIAAGNRGSKVFSYSLNSDLGWDDGLICGGEMKVAVEVLGKGSDLRGLRKLQADLAGRRMGELVVGTGGGGYAAAQGRDAHATDGAGEACSSFVLRYMPAPRLVLVGAGHVSRALAVQAGLAGFLVEVVDDRAEYVTAERFPGAGRYVGDVATVLEAMPLDEATYVVIATRGHRNDAAALRAVVGKAAVYKGLLGSKRKVLTLMKELRAEGVSVEALKEIRAPIGVAIGAVTPEEIAVSVLAELIALRRGMTPPAALGVTAEMVERHT